MTQRETPPRLQGIDDDEEEKTSVGAAPDPEGARPSPLGSPLGGPLPPQGAQVPPAPRVNFGKFNTPTAFTPHQGTPHQPQPQPQPPPQTTQQPHDPRSSTAMTAARPLGNAPDSGSLPPKSMPRPLGGGSGSSGNMPRVQHHSAAPPLPGASSSSPPSARGDERMNERGSSGPA